MNLTVTVRDSVRVGHFTALPGAVYGLATAWIAWAFFAQLTSTPLGCWCMRRPERRHVEMAKMPDQQPSAPSAERGYSV